jgi:DNA primase catalytic core domain protein
MNITETIIQQVDIIDFIGKYTNLHQSGRYWKGKCPLHESDDTSETLVVFPDTNSFYCFSCECGGSVINFLSDKEKVSYRAATEILAKECNISLKDNKEYQLEASEEMRFTREADMYHKNVGAIGEYLAKRGLTNSTINDFNLGFHSDCLTIPLRNEHGQYVSMAIRQFNKKPKYKNTPNSILYKKSSFLFNLDLARKKIKDRLYVCEGYMDAMSGHQMGEPTVAYCGSELHRDQIRKLAGFIRKEITIVICPDNDEAGVKHLPRTRDHFQSMLPKANIRVLIMPEECKDINDLLCAGYELADLPTEHIDIFVIKQLVKRYKTIEEQYVVAESFLKTIRSPMIRAEAIQALGEIWKRDVSDLKAYFDSGVSSEQDLLETLHDASSSLNQLRDIYKRGTYPTHFQLLDNCIGGVSKGQVFLIGAYSSSGKSDIAIEYILRQIVQNKANVVFFSLEMPRGKIMERIVCKILKKRIAEVKELIIQGDPLVNQVLDKIGKKLYIVDENNLSMHDIERYINTINTRNIMEGGVDVIVVDYFTYLKGAGDYDGASEQALMMKGIAKRYNVIFTMLSQLNRSGNTYEEPTMNQLRMTGDLEASADYILMIWRPDRAPNLSLEKQQELRNITRCKVEKARDGMNGPPMFELKYDVYTSRLEEVLTTDN